MAEFVPPPGTEFLTVLKCKFYGMTDVIPTAYAGAAKPKLPPLSTLRDMLRKNRPSRQAVRLICTDKGIAGVNAKTGRLIFRFSTAMIATLLSSRHPEIANRRVGMLLCRVRGHATWYVFKYPPQGKTDPLCAVMKRIVAHNLQRLGQAALRDAQSLGPQTHHHRGGTVSRVRTHSWASSQPESPSHNHTLSAASQSVTAAAAAAAVQQQQQQQDRRVSRSPTRHRHGTVTSTSNGDRIPRLAENTIFQYPQGPDYANLTEATASSRDGDGSPMYYVQPTPIREEHSYEVIADHSYVSFTSSPMAQ